MKTILSHQKGKITDKDLLIHARFVFTREETLARS